MQYEKELDTLAEVLANLSNKSEMKKLLLELLTESEQKTLLLRWRLLKDLFAGKTQRDIASDLGISLCKITRGSKILKDQDSAILKILKDK